MQASKTLNGYELMPGEPVEYDSSAMKKSPKTTPDQLRYTLRNSQSRATWDTPILYFAQVALKECSHVIVPRVTKNYGDEIQRIPV